MQHTIPTVRMKRSDKEFNEYRLADKSYTPFYIQYPEDKVHRLCFSYDLDGEGSEIEGMQPMLTELIEYHNNITGSHFEER